MFTLNNCNKQPVSTVTYCEPAQIPLPTGCDVCEKEKGPAAWDVSRKQVHRHTSPNIWYRGGGGEHLRHLNSVSVRTNSFINMSCHPAFVSLQVRRETQPEWREIRTFPVTRIGPKFTKLMIP